MATPRPRVLLIDDNADKLVALESILWDLDVRIVKARGSRRRTAATSGSVVVRRTWRT